MFRRESFPYACKPCSCIVMQHFMLHDGAPHSPALHSIIVGCRKSLVLHCISLYHGALHCVMLPCRQLRSNLCCMFMPWSIASRVLFHCIIRRAVGLWSAILCHNVLCILLALWRIKSCCDMLHFVGLTVHCSFVVIHFFCLVVAGVQ